MNAAEISKPPIKKGSHRMYGNGGESGADFYIRNIAHCLRYLNEQKLAEHKITDQQARLLGVIRKSISDGVKISRKFLQERMDLSGPSVTGLLNGLQKNGFIVRYADTNDGRAMQIQMTDKGERIIKALEQVFLDTEQLLLDGMTEEETDIFLGFLNKAYNNIPRIQGQ